MRDPVAFLLFLSLLAIVFLKGNQGHDQEKINKWNKEITESFTFFDKNVDDYIDENEFSVTYNREYIRYAFKKFDVDKDGKLNMKEFTKEWLEFDESLSVDNDKKLC